MVDKPPYNPNLILPVGTQVVATIEIKGTGDTPQHPEGAVGVIIKAPSDNTHPYRVRFVDGFEASLKRQELAILTHFKGVTNEKKHDALKEYNLYEHVIYKCVVGSRAYGLDNEESDTDLRGIYLPPADMQWSLYGVPEQLENEDNEECYWELQKFITLALKANPNVLECLYSPLVEHVTPLAQELLDMKSIFLSKLVYQTYNGYVMSQFKRMQNALKNKGEIKLKHAMHLIRLLLSGITVLKEGFVPLRVDEHRDELLAIRNKEMPFEEIETWRKKLHREFDAAFEETELPDRPDYEAANAFLVKARRSVLK